MVSKWSLQQNNVFFLELPWFACQCRIFFWLNFKMRGKPIDPSVKLIVCTMWRFSQKKWQSNQGSSKKNTLFCCSDHFPLCTLAANRAEWCVVNQSSFACDVTSKALWSTAAPSPLLFFSQSTQESCSQFWESTKFKFWSESDFSVSFYWQVTTGKLAVE